MANTIASVLHRTGGKVPGLAQTRAMLVIAWIGFQSFRVTDGYAGAVLSPLWIVPYAVVPALFALLGFCLAQAAATGTPRTFLLDRVRRAGPVLLVTVLATALLLGPAQSTDGLRAYLTDPAFASYFLNLAGWPRFDLPGVFEFNDYSEVVNEALWLTPCFAVVAIGALGAMRSRAPRWFALAAAFATLAGYVAGEVAGLIPSPAGSALRNSFVGNGLAAIFAGQCGVLCYLWRERAVIGWPIPVGAGFVLAALALFGNPGLIERPGVPVAIALLAGAVAIAASARRMPGAWIAAYAAPVLHGAMLLSFPLQQLAIDLGPSGQTASTNLALSLPVAVVLGWALHWISTRFGLAAVRIGPDLGEAGQPLPDIRGKRWWQNLAQQFAVGLGIALVVAAAGLIVILLTVAALQQDPIGV